MVQDYVSYKGNKGKGSILTLLADNYWICKSYLWCRIM
nr:MAG TPA: hypothetical protein [Caudoviricetes sp.]